MRTRFAVVVVGVLFANVALAGGPGIREEQVRFQEGRSAATLEGKLKGYEVVDYKVGASAGQSMAVRFRAGHPSAYFNVLPPGSDEAIFIGSVSGNRFEGELPVDGVYTIRVYLMRSAARRKEGTSYTLDVGVRSKRVGPS